VAPAKRKLEFKERRYRRLPLASCSPCYFRGGRLIRRISVAFHGYPACLVDRPNIAVITHHHSAKVSRDLSHLLQHELLRVVRHNAPSNPAEALPVVGAHAVRRQQRGSLAVIDVSRLGTLKIRIRINKRIPLFVGDWCLLAFRCLPKDVN
jgi:hypothetical protein